jgi:pseudaminic acid synthase
VSGNELDWWQRPRRVSVVCDNPSWVVPYCQDLVERLNALGDEARFCARHDEIEQGDVAFYIGCVRITPPDVLARNRRNLVAHASDLPAGRGFSPLTWQVLEGRNQIPLCLLEAAEGVDEGPVVFRDTMTFEGHELLDELHERLGRAQVDLALRYMAADAPPVGVAQTGEGSVYPRRGPKDSRLDADAPLATQFDLLRTVDNAKYPAFFEARGHRYRLAIEKADGTEAGFDAVIRIGDRLIGPGHPPYVVAELSGNHNGDLGRALKLMDAAAAAGADAVKLQTYTADTLTIKHDGPDFGIKGGLWGGRTLYDLYEEAHTPWDWHPALFGRGRELGIEVFSSPFDETAIDFLEDLGAPAHKIASFEMTDHALIRRAAATGKPLVVSTGMANAREIAESVEVIRRAGCKQVILLHCVSSYPTEPKDINLRTMPELARRFGTVPGLSDHTHGTAVSVASIALGSCFIEKHFTLRRADGGPDSAFSLEPEEFKELTQACRTAWEALGRVHFDLKGAERGNTVFRRSLYVVADVPAGAALTAGNVRSIRPGYGLAPKHLPDVIGRKVARALKRGEALSWDMIEGGE